MYLLRIYLNGPVGGEIYMRGQKSPGATVTSIDKSQNSTKKMFPFKVRICIYKVHIKKSRLLFI